MNSPAVFLATALFAVPAAAQELPSSPASGGVDEAIANLAKEWSGVSLAQGHFQKQLEAFIREYQTQQTQLRQAESKLKWTLENWVPKQPSSQPPAQQP